MKCQTNLFIVTGWLLHNRRSCSTVFSTAVICWIPRGPTFP